MPKSTYSRHAQAERAAVVADPFLNAEETAGLLAETDRDAMEQSADESNSIEIVSIHRTTCACGCGAEITSKRLFRQGHDQRLIGLLARAAARGKEIAHQSDGMLVTGSAQTYGAKVLTDTGVAKLDAAVKKATERFTIVGD